MTTASAHEAQDISGLIERYDVFFIDQFGVLHDGTNPYPGAIDALVKLKAARKTVVLLSNSGKRARPNEQRIEKLGFHPGSWDLFVSSGEVAWRKFAGEMGEPALNPGTKCLLIARDGDVSAIDELGLQPVTDGATAEIILLSASEGDRYPLEHYEALLKPAAARGVRLVCTNPDKIMLTKVGPRYGAGRIAELYAELGGEVEWIGKPFPEIYEAALRLCGNPDRANVVCIGDSIEHDIAGGNGAGLATALVRSGILADLPAMELEALYAEHGVTPDHVIARFAFR